MIRRVGFLSLCVLSLVACGLFSGVQPAPLPTVAVAPTPSHGGITRQIDETLPDVRVGQSGNTCGFVAADLKRQSVSGTLAIFPNQAQSTLRGVLTNGLYRGAAHLLDSNCRPAGNQYNLNATFVADYSAALGQTGGSQCIRQSNLVVTSFNLQGLPGPLNSVAQTLLVNEVPGRVQGPLDEFVVKQLNGGRLSASGAHCS